MIVEALPFQTHLAVSRIDSGRTAGGPVGEANPFGPDKVEISVWDVQSLHDIEPTIREDVVRHIRAEVEAGTYLNRERINATADRLHRAFAPAGRPRGPSL